MTAPDTDTLAALLDYDAGLLNDWGGGNVEWWQDYLRAEIGRANEFWREQVENVPALRSAPPVGARVKKLVDDAEFLREAGTDAAKWAAGFKAVAERLGHDGMDEGWLIGWFANAIEASRRAAVSDELSLAAADVVAWFDLCRPDLSGPRISRLRYALAALLPAGEGEE